MTHTRCYYENLDALVDKLATRPEGKLDILIGSQDSPDVVLNDLIQRVQRKGTSLGQWLLAKMARGECEIRVGDVMDGAPDDGCVEQS